MLLRLQVHHGRSQRDRGQRQHYFYTSPSNDSSWGYDLLGDDGILQSGYQGTVTIGDGSDQCEYDFKFVMEDESETVINGVDICSLNEYTIYD